MKRLKYYLNQMQNNSITYHDIYAGKTIVRFPPQMIRGVLVEPDPQMLSRIHKYSISVIIGMNK